MWNVYRGDPLAIRLGCEDENEDAVDLTGYTIGVNLVWGDDEDERLEYTASDSELVVTEATGSVVLTVSGDTTQDTLPLGKKTLVFLVLTPPSADQFTTLMGRITVRDA